MITNFKIFEKKVKDLYYFYDDMKKDAHDVDYFLNLIKTKNVTSDELERLFYWSCREFPKLSLALIDVMPARSIQKEIRGIVQLDVDDFKKLIEKNDIYKGLITNKEFLEEIIYYGHDKVDKFKILEKLGATFNQRLLSLACYAGRINIVKYLIDKGFDPNIKKEASFSHAPQNCLDDATLYNKTPDVIKYLVEDLNMPVTYRHIYNVLVMDNFDALPSLINSKNIIDDYSYSMYATHNEDQHPFYFSSLISKILNKNQEKYIIPLFKGKNDGYDDLQSLPSIKNYNNILDPKYLELAYRIIKNYKGNSSNSSSIRFITRNNEEFWFKKMKQDPSIISKLIKMDDEVIKSYKFQKLILDIDKDNLKYIINKLHPKILIEYGHLPGVINIIASKFNI